MARDAALRIWLLGGFRVSVGSRVIDESAWRLRKARSLIKLLALTPRFRLHREQVMEVLWPGIGPAAAANNLHQVLHFARHTLRPDLPPRSPAAYLRLQEDTLTLCDPGQVWVDAAAFEVAAAAARLAQGAYAYRVAIDLYMGDLLPDDLYEDWARDRREELRQTYLSLLLELARLCEASQDIRAAIATLEQLVATDPLHEEAHAALMRLHAMVGERPQALRQYQGLLERLQQELGTEPDASTQRLYQEILANQFPTQVSIPPPEEAAAIRATRRKRLPRTRPRVQTKPPEAIAGNLPVPLTSFVGREREIAEIKEALPTVRLFTLVGPGGCGKTRLALRVAADVLNDYQDGAWFVDLASLTNPTLVPATVASSLGLVEDPSRPPTASVADFLQSRRLLLVLDNCEHLAEGCADLATRLLESCPRLQILATSRHALKVPGELTWRVPSLSLPEHDWLPSRADLMQYDAVHLFAERARLARSEFTVRHQNGATVAEICRRLDGLPLAIELAAARLGVLSLNEMVDRLQDRFRLLVGESAGQPGRQQTLRASIDWSYDLLSQTEQVLFDRLAVFKGGFTLDAGEAVCAGDGIAASDMLDLLAHLVDKSMVVVEETPDGSVRYRLLEILREYGWARLVARGEPEDIQRRHAGFFLTLAERAEPELHGPNQRVWLERLELDHNNFRVALEWGRKEEEGAEAWVRLAAALSWFWYVRGYWTEGREWLRDALSRSNGVTASARANALNGAGVLAWGQDDYQGATALYEKGLALFRELRDRRGIAYSLRRLGIVAWRQGDYERAAALHEESLILFRELQDTRGIASAQNSLGFVARYQGDYARAVTLHEESLALLRELGEKRGIADSLSNLGAVAQSQGDFSRAAALHEEGLALFRELGEKRGIADSLGNLGMVAQHQGDSERATALYRESLALRRELGDRRGIAECLTGLAGVAAAQGQPKRAARLLGAAEVLREAIGVPLQPSEPSERAEYEHNRAALCAALGDEAFSAAWAAGRKMPLEEAVGQEVKPTTKPQLRAT